MQFVPEVLHPVQGTHAGTVCEELQPMGRTYPEGLSCSRDPTLEQGESARRKDQHRQPVIN